MQSFRFLYLYSARDDFWRGALAQIGTLHSAVLLFNRVIWLKMKVICAIINFSNRALNSNLGIIIMESENNKKSLFPVNPNSKYSVIILLAALIVIIGITFLMWFIGLVNQSAVRLCLVLLIIVTYTAVAVTAMFLTGQQKQLVPSKNKLWLQILIGVGIAAFLCFFVGILPILCGTSFVGSHSDMSVGQILLAAMQDILFVGVGEEIVFRGYIQNQFTIWLKKCKWLAPLIAAVLFGLWHLINGSLIQVLFTTVIGCVFGYAKYFIKDCSLLSVIIAHGLYDFSLVLLTCFML